MERLDRDARGQHYAIDAPDEELVPASTADDILHTAPRQRRFRAYGSQCPQHRGVPVETRACGDPLNMMRRDDKCAACCAVQGLDAAVHVARHGLGCVRDIADRMVSPARALATRVCRASTRNNFETQSRRARGTRGTQSLRLKNENSTRIFTSVLTPPHR